MPEINKIIVQISTNFISDIFSMKDIEPFSISTTLIITTLTILSLSLQPIIYKIYKVYFEKVLIEKIDQEKSKKHYYLYLHPDFGIRERMGAIIKIFSIAYFRYYFGRKSSFDWFSPKNLPFTRERLFFTGILISFIFLTIFGVLILKIAIVKTYQFFF